MKKNPLVATKLVDGTAKTPDVSPVTLWWPHHAGCVITYALDDASKDAALLARERSAVKDSGAHWETLVPDAARRRRGGSTGLMREHVELEIALVDATVLADPKRMDEVSRALGDNADAHRARYARAIRRFPEMTFSGFMHEHVRILVKIMHGTLQGEDPTKNSTDFIRNSVRMGALMTEWF